LKDGARVVETADDILQGLGWGIVPPMPQTATSAAADPVLRQMAPGDPYGLEELSTLTGLTGPEVLARITELEIAGRVTASMGVFTRLS
jgi:DNA processing protein